MELLNKISEDYKTAFKAKDTVAVETLRLLKAALTHKEKETGNALSEAEVLAVLKKLAKQYRDSIESFEQAERPDLSEHEKQQLEVLTRYLPEEMSESEIRAKVSEMLAAMSAEEKTNLGKVIGAVMKATAGKAPGELVKKIVSELLV